MVNGGFQRSRFPMEKCVLMFKVYENCIECLHILQDDLFNNTVNDVHYNIVAGKPLVFRRQEKAKCNTLPLPLVGGEVG